VISQSSARKYFAAESPIGRTLLLNGQHSVTVTGVLRDLPHNTHLKGDFFIPDTSSAEQLSAAAKEDWFAFRGWTYVRLLAGADPSLIELKSRDLIGRHLDPGVLNALHARAQDVVRVKLTPFQSVHLTTDKIDGMRPGGSRVTLVGFTSIAALILLIACFNFMNLATARAMLRSTEVSLRKVLGARRQQLITQFLGEAVLVALLAFLLSVAFVALLLPSFDELLGRPITLHYAQDWPVPAGIGVLAVITGLLAGSYPAFVLSGFRPAIVLRSNKSQQHGSGLLRTLLVVAQFAISIALGIAALVISRQIDYARHLDYGFDRQSLVVLEVGSPAPDPTSVRSFMSMLRADSNIVGIAASGAVPFEGGSENQEGAVVAGNPQLYTVRTLDITPDFPTTYGMRLVAGRFLAEERGTDINTAEKEQAGFTDGKNVLIDLNAARQMGFSATGALGKTITIKGKHLTIVGVLQNVLFHAAQAVPVPTVYYYNLSGLSRISVRVRSARIPEALAVIDKSWHQWFPTVAIQRHFLQETFDGILATERQEGAIFSVFVAIAIFIACLGLFGLAAFTAERRTKEIGMRKIFGARTRDIVGLLLWQFSIPVLIAAAVAWPVAWYYLHRWLEGYAYRVALAPAYFAEAGAAALLISCLTVSAHAVRVSRENPIKALRYE
jgi:putative ABC transport system permease protein